MKDFNKIIDNWVNKNTVPCTTLPERSQINFFRESTIKHLKEEIKPGEDFDELVRKQLDEYFGCRFINYNGEHRIILKDQKFKHDFYLCAWDSPKYDYNAPTINDLVYKLLDPEIEEGDSHFDDSYWVVIQDINDLIKVFNIDYKFNEPIECNWRVNNGKYEFSGDGWDTSGTTAFEDSDLFKVVKKYLTNKLEYEYAPYTKYNPINFLDINNSINNFDEIFTKLNKQQIINVLTTKYGYHENSIADEYTNAKEFIKLLQSIDDMNLIKQIIKSLKIGEDTFVHLCNRIYNI